MYNYSTYVCLCRNELDELQKMTEEDPVISALEDVVEAPYQENSNCERLFGKGTSNQHFSMSTDFQANIQEFLSAVDASVAGREDLEGNSFQMKAEYRFLHYLTTRLEFVRTVCETGMTD